MHRCRFCAAPLSHVAIDLGMSPLSNALVDPADRDLPETFYPLRAMVCDRCWLVQLPQVETPERIFSDYPYYSSVSTSWLAHARAFAASAVERFRLSPASLVVELASNDGYLLKEFARAGVGVLGVEPARNVARAAEAEGVPTIVEFFGAELARRLVAQGRSADLIVAINVLAHVPDLNDFVAGIAIVLRPGGTAVLEFPHLLRTVERAEFDTIYHEHFSYFSLRTARAVFEAHGMRIADVEELPTHGGSLRVIAHLQSGATSKRATPAVDRIEASERAAGLDRLETYAAFQSAAHAVKRDLLAWLIDAKRARKRVAGYGAPAKATTLLNFCGIRTDLVDFTVDRSPQKMGRLIPGVRIPIEPPDRIREARPDYVLIFPWNIADEVREQMSDVGAWGGRFAVPIPALTVLETPEASIR